MGQIIDLTGRRFGHLTVIEFAGLSPRRAALWLCACDCGEKSTVIGRHLRTGNTRSCGHLQGNGGGRPRQAIVSYTGAHTRVEVRRGKARAFKCFDCPSPAAEWSYTRRDIAELVDDRGRPYSVDPLFYVPRCRPCHRRFDNQLPVVA